MQGAVRGRLHGGTGAWRCVLSGWGVALVDGVVEVVLLAREQEDLVGRLLGGRLGAAGEGVGAGGAGVGALGGRVGVGWCGGAVAQGAGGGGGDAGGGGGEDAAGDVTG